MAGDLGTNAWRGVASTLADGLVVLDEDGRRVWSDARVEVLLGEHLAEPAPLTWLACDAEHAIPTSRGPRYVETRVVGVTDEGHRIVAFRDLGERLRLRAELSDVRATMARAGESVTPGSTLAQGMLAAVMVHELATPLTVLALVLDPIHGSEALAGRSLADARSAVEHLQHLVASMRGARVRPPTHAVDLAEVVEQALRLAGPALIEARAEARVRLEGPTTALGERTRLVQVVTNLVVNAAHAVAGRGPERLVRIETCEHEGCVVIDVHDAGAGIDAADLARVFEPFFTTKPPGVGTGIGLALSRRLVEDLGGTLELRSELGVGTRARIRLARP